ncbi:hypothetical protein [Glycomyces artemisiae]|uniref:Uncharacterized protein n=1 Tax=Glycomyces artemisiae TaxID=1076443 RepID=A0A2T0UXC2_9ACTN|nr:hypothetical protein [Glycomyces artemisiae]PRY62562.1 hypothetical protein B0I28_101896 [Glycomyces artemisiae]
MSKFHFSGDGNVTIGAVNPAGPVTIGAMGQGSTAHFHGSPPSSTTPRLPQSSTPGKHRKAPKLRGMAAALDNDALRSRIEDATADLIDWAAVQGPTDDPWTVEVWIEPVGSGHSLDLYFKARRHYIDASGLTYPDGTVWTDELATTVVERITRLAAADPTPYQR